jgi:hypothetical protein
MGRLLFFLLLLSRMDATAIHAQQDATISGPPQQMRICVAHLCETLTWAGDHYDGTPDGEKKPREQFVLKRWDGVFVLESTGRAEDGNDRDLDLTGAIASSGDHVDAGLGTVGLKHFDFTATWKPGSASASAAAYLRRIAPIDDSHRSKTHPNILLPPGAAEVYASWPDDIRAILMPGGHPLTHEDAGRPCDDAKEDDRDNTGVYDAGLALEIGKFALRNGEYLRGRCWINHSAVLNQNPRAVVLLGILHLMGWTLPKDGDRACRNFSAEYRSGDPWAAYFLDRCYREGLGGRVNLTYAGQIETSALLSDDAQRMFNLIGWDDLEVQRQKDLDALAGDPTLYYNACAPLSQKETSERQRGLNAGDDSCAHTVNQVLMDKKVKEINDRYSRIQ